MKTNLLSRISCGFLLVVVMLIGHSPVACAQYYYAQPTYAAPAYAQPTYAQQSSVDTLYPPNSNVTNAYTAGPAPKKDYTLSWSTEMLAEHTLDTLSNQQNEIQLGLTMKFDTTFSSWLSMNLTPRVVAQNGYIQAPDAVDPQGSRIDIMNASLDFKPSHLFMGSIGSLDESRLHSDLFMSPRSFPAVRLTSVMGAEKSSHFYIFAETAIPSSSSISNNNADLGQTPSLNTAGIGFQVGSDREGYTVKSYFNAYQFAGLSEDLATSSVLLGNTGVSTAGSLYQFADQYQGYESKLEGKFHLTRPLTMSLFGEAVDNTQAATDDNLGWDLGGSVKYDFTRNLQIEPKFDYYRIEADSTVATYNDPMMNTNRVGYRTQMIFYLYRKVKLNVSYGQRVPITVNPSQPSETWYGLGVETENAQL